MIARESIRRRLRLDQRIATVVAALTQENIRRSARLGLIVPVYVYRATIYLVIYTISRVVVLFCILSDATDLPEGRRPIAAPAAWNSVVESVSVSSRRGLRRDQRSALPSPVPSHLNKMVNGAYAKGQFKSAWWNTWKPNIDASFWSV